MAGLLNKNSLQAQVFDVISFTRFKDMILVTLKCDLDVQQTRLVTGNFWDECIEHLSRTQVSQQSVTKIMSVTIMYLVTPKAGAKHELLFNKPASGQGEEPGALPLCQLGILPT